MTIGFFTVTVYSITVICSLLLAQAHAQCSDGWFGSRCQFQCHCKNTESCDAYSGQCSDDLCTTGWFDRGCQYVDWTAQSDAPGWLSDGDDTTCNPEPANDTITINFDETQLITRYRLVGDTSSSVAADVLAALQITINGTATTVSDRFYKYNGNMVEFFVDAPQYVAGYVFSGTGVAVLCSIYMTSGRNVALKQNATLSSQLGGTSDAMSAVDGNSGQDSKTDMCAQTKAGDNNPSWGVEFDLTVQIYRMSVYGVDHKTYPQFQLNPFEVQGYDVNVSQVYTYQAKPVTSSRYSVYEATPAVKSLKFVPTAGGKTFHICELEAYGDTDCIDGKFGPECTYNCYCEKDTCSATGWCDSGCAEGYKEPYCLGCPEGFYGPPACQRECSENCFGDCEVEDGACKAGCKPGFWGKGCSRTCENCVEGCDQESGACVGEAEIVMGVLVFCCIAVMVFSMWAWAVYQKHNKKMNEEGVTQETKETMFNPLEADKQPLAMLEDKASNEGAGGSKSGGERSSSSKSTTTTSSSGTTSSGGASSGETHV